MSILVDRSTKVIARRLTSAACAALMFAAGASAQGQETADSAVDRFFTICGGHGVSAVDRLPGESITSDETPRFFESDVRRSGTNHRLTRTDGGIAMRAVMQGDADPRAIIVKCAFATDQTSYDTALAELAAAAGGKPYESGGEGESRRAMFMSADAPFQIFEEADGWVSIYRMEILINARGIDPDYLKEGAKPVPIPRAR